MFGVLGRGIPWGGIVTFIQILHVHLRHRFYGVPLHAYIIIINQQIAELYPWKRPLTVWGPSTDQLCRLAQPHATLDLIEASRLHDKRPNYPYFDREQL